MGEASPPDPSPYRPPPMLAEPEPDQPDHSDQPAAAWPPLPLPLWVSAAFAAGALAVHLGVMVSERATRELIVFSIQPFLPLALLALFTLFCLRWYSAQPLAGSRSLSGMLLIFLLVPPVSLLIFVPAFLAITLLVVFAVGHWPLLMVSALACAYFLTAVGISRWLWWWFACQR